MGDVKEGADDGLTFLSSISHSNPLLSVVGKSVVLSITDYCSWRPTQHQEADVYFCESYFDEGKRITMPHPEPLKKYNLGPAVKQDELYKLKHLITPEKEVLPGPVGAPRNISSPILDINEDSMDVPPSVGSVESGLGIHDGWRSAILWPRDGDRCLTQTNR